MKRRLIILGSTGSIGTQTLEVVEHLNNLHRQGQFPYEYTVVGLAAGTNSQLAFAQAAATGARHVALAAPASAPGGITLLEGPSAAEQLVRRVECDVVLAAVVGAAGLPATLAAVELGRQVALANKETLVAAGSLVIPAARKSGSTLLPVDSEHAGVWQCLPNHAGPAAPPGCADHAITRVVLTASGGPFRTWERAAMQAATPEQALKHPTWTMGRKVTIDSASLMNKALELIEAHWLFGLPADRLGAIIHPQSIVHAMVDYADGSTIAQLGAPDMRTPIQYALTWPHRADGVSKKIDWTTLTSLEFQQIDPAQFPAPSLALRAIETGGAAGAILNAANEIAVEAFLARQIPFGRISTLVAETLDALPRRDIDTLQDCLTADAAARDCARSRLAG
ncbi:MAG: 1-deoxy-D-xylulose-5-phosphate reductoisomerase [Planctomycetes bacterium]|nr:1-deoxy-D-xylulose-5-phosphate reductoisomerase [Planctomycetota bacterium]